MDIGTHRPGPSRTASEEKLSLAASSTVYTYHCLCNHLVLATTTPLPALPTRQHSLDKAHIMPLAPPPPATKPSNPHLPKPDVSHCGVLVSTKVDREAEILQSDDGFEKRYLYRCGGCNLVIGYQLDWQLFENEADATKFGRREDALYILPGGLVTTSEMIQGKKPSPGAISIVSVTEVKT